MFARREILVGDAEVIVAGGMESMTNAPYLLPKARSGYRMGNGEIIDSMIHDGLWDPYDNVHMGNCGDARRREVRLHPRGAGRLRARELRARASAAQKAGTFKAEIVAVPVPQKKGDPLLVDEDEGPTKAQLDKMRGLRPAFSKEGTVTAANASSINDGAAALRRDLGGRGGEARLQGARAHRRPTRPPRWSPSGSRSRRSRRCAKLYAKTGHEARSTGTSTRSTRRSRA